MTPRTQARLVAVDALYIYYVGITDPNSMGNQYKVHRDIDLDCNTISKYFKQSEAYSKEKGRKYSRNFAYMLYKGTLEKQNAIESAIAKYMVKGWGLDRLSCIFRAIIMPAVFEVIFIDNIPSKVAINEYINISNIYTNVAESSAINKILDSIMYEYNDRERNNR